VTLTIDKVWVYTGIGCFHHSTHEFNPLVEFWLWRVVVIVSEFTLFLTSHYDVIFTFATQDFGEVCW